MRRTSIGLNTTNSTDPFSGDPNYGRVVPYVKRNMMRRIANGIVDTGLKVAAGATPWFVQMLRLAQRQAGDAMNNPIVID